MWEYGKSGNTQKTSKEDESSNTDVSTTDVSEVTVSEIKDVDINMDFNSSLIDFIEKTGFEAAAATAVMVTEACALEEPEVKEFVADEPFKYMILTDSENPELLFYGQLVE